MFLFVNIFWYTGTSDGQTKIVREGDNGVAYAWNKREQKWDKVIYNLVRLSISDILLMLFVYISRQLFSI